MSEKEINMKTKWLTKKNFQIEKIIKLNPLANRSELQRLSSEHIEQIYSYWLNEKKIGYKL